MPIRTNRERLSPGPMPDRPPWVVLTTREVMDLLDVSGQTTFNWASRRTGPPRIMTASRRAHYPLAGLWHWLQGPESPSAEARIRAYLSAHEMEAGRATYRMGREVGQWCRHALVRVQSLSGSDLERLCKELDRVKAFEREPAARQQQERAWV